jgi:succinate-semialdehyde dehydrogenase/glutarate-semialdehyde dehydrogenase
MPESVAVRNPYSGDNDYSFIEPSTADIAATCQRLRANQPAWAAKSLSQRIEVLRSFADAIRSHRDELVAALIADTGRSQVPVIEVDALPGMIERVATEAPLALAGKPPTAAHIPVIEGSSNRVPYGLVGNISPWNFPVILSFLDTFPALAGGNSVVIKPSEITPRWVEPMRAALADCPEIAAVLDIVVGRGAVGAAINSAVDAIVFTGSVATGRLVGETAARQFIPAHLELGGKDPAIILPSANIHEAARTATFCSVQSTGQACQSLERIYVSRTQHDEFVASAVEMAENLPLNYPDIDGGVIGPFIFEQQAYKVLEQIEDAVAKGATLHCGGEILDHGGLWMRPTVLSNVTHQMLVMQEETFGPVVPIMAYASEDDAVALANDSQYGLSAAVFAGTVEEGRKFAARIKAGAVSVNDAALTAAIHQFEHDAFGFSGLGTSRAGQAAYTRFTREQVVMANTAGQSVMLSQLDS